MRSVFTPLQNTMLSPLRLCLIALFALNIFIYSQSADGPYIIDDIPNLTNNSHLIIEQLNLESIKNAALSSPASRFYRPVSMLSFAANYTLAGNKSPYSIKITNIFIHALIGLGIFLLTINLLPKISNQSLLHADGKHIELIGFLTTVVWLFHPLFVSTVLYSVQRMAMLSTLFVVYGCFLYIKLREKTIKEGSGFGSLFTWISLLSMVAFFSKENGFLLFGFLLIIELFCFHFAFHNNTNKLNRYALKIFLVLPVAFVFVYLLHTYIGSANDEITAYSYTYHERLLTQLRVLWRYVGWLMFVNPEPMGIYHDDTLISTSLLQPVTTSIALAAWLIVLTAIAVFFRTRHVLLFCILWFLWGHSLESTVLPLGIIYEHRNYLPGYGMLLGFVILMTEFLRSIKAKYTIRFGIGLVLMILLPGYLLTERVANWRDQRSLILALLEHKPDSAFSTIMAAHFLYDSGDYDSALKAVHQAQQLDAKEPSHQLAEAAMHCDHNPNEAFDEQLTDKLLSLQRIDKVSAPTLRQFRQLTKVCLHSTANHTTLLKFYTRIKNSSNNTMAMLAYYGIGAIHLQRKEYLATIKAWEAAIEKDKNALGLLPTLQKVRQDYAEQRLASDNAVTD